jgi:toxin ParE1/3/4
LIPVDWARPARDDAHRIWLFLTARDAERADFVQDRILGRERVLADHPYLGPPGRVRGTRELSVIGTPYFPVYRVRVKERGSEVERVEVLRVRHRARRWPPKAPVRGRPRRGA